MKKVLVSVAVTAALMFAGGAFAAKGGGGNPGKGNQGCKLADGSTYKNPGDMFQHLRIRENNASGNPKDIVNAYPNSFESVGDLIDKKCGVAPS